MSKFFLTILVSSSLVFWGCVEEPVIEIPVSNDPATSSLSALAEVISTFDIVEDVVSRNEFFLKKDDSFLPSSVIFYFTDTSFNDGDGLEAMLDFGSLGNAPHGVLCKDHKYRAGKIWLSLNKPYNESDAQLTISFSSEFPFYSGDGEVMNAMKGNLTLTRASDNELILESSDLIFTTKDKDYQFQSNISITHEEDYGIGLINDILGFQGNVVITGDLEEVRLSTVMPLVKEYTLDCAKHILEGVMDIEVSSSSSEMSIDFDPYKDGACDNKYELTVNDKSVIYEY